MPIKYRNMNPILAQFLKPNSTCGLTLNLTLFLGLEIRDLETTWSTGEDHSLVAIRIHSGARIAIPSNVKRLVEKIQLGSEEHFNFLERLAKAFVSFPLKDGQWNASFNTYTFCEQISLLEEQGLIEWVNEEAPLIINDLLSDAFDNPRFEISLSPKSNFIRDYYVQLLAWSARRQEPFVSRNIRIFDTLGNYLPTLQLPVNIGLADPNAVLQLSQAKQDRMSAILALHPALPTAKFYLGIASIIVAGLDILPEKFTSAAATAGVVLAFTDP